MPKCLIATFGWTEHYVLSSILKHGIEQGDAVILLVPAKRDEKSESILRDFGSFLSKYGEGIRLEVRRIPVESFDNAVAAISEILKEALSKKPDKVIINLSGGMRVLILATYVAVLLSCPRDVLIELETEDREKGYIIPNLSLWGLIELKGVEKEILMRLGEGAKSVPKLLEELRIPRSTLHKYLKTLEKRGLISLKRDGKTLIASAAALGKLMLLGAR
ncbi:MAG: CRISPR-associated CARF protein Csa3 [Aigarchaeota archaeon]|nr:CRISPR-associated CARF protein Csa3 [Aigarchaeota archaeon]